MIKDNIKVGNKIKYKGTPIDCSEFLTTNKVYTVLNVINEFPYYAIEINDDYFTGNGDTPLIIDLDELHAFEGGL